MNDFSDQNMNVLKKVGHKQWDLVTVSNCKLISHQVAYINITSI